MIKMSTNICTGQEPSSQLQAELAEFEEVLREYKIDMNPSKYIALTTEEYEDAMEVFEEFLKYQDGFELEPENNSLIEQPDNVQPMEVDDANSFDKRDPITNSSVSEMKDLYLANVDVEMEPFAELNLEPVCDLDFNALELDDLIPDGANDNVTPNDKPILIPEKPQSSKNVLEEPGYTEVSKNTSTLDKEHQYGQPPVLTAQVTPTDLNNEEEISVDIKYHHSLMENIPMNTDDIPTDTDEISTDADETPTDTDDISTEPEDFSTESEDVFADNEDIPTKPKNISTDPFATLPLENQNSSCKPVPYTINTWLLDREKERQDKLNHKLKKTGTTSPSTVTRSCSSSAMFHPRRSLFFDNGKESLPSIPESGSQSQKQKGTNEKTCIYEEAINRTKVKQTNQSSSPRRTCCRELRRTCRST